MAQLRATDPYIWVTWIPRLLSGRSSCEWSSWFKAQHEGWSWSRMPFDFDQTDWLLNHTALLNDSVNVGATAYSVLTEGQNSFNLRGISAVWAGKADLVAKRRIQIRHDQDRRPSPPTPLRCLLHVALPLAMERYRGSSTRRQLATPTMWSTYRPTRSTEVCRNTGRVIRRWRRRCLQAGAQPERCRFWRLPRPTARYG